MPTNLLNLPQYRVLRVDETEHDYHVTVEPVESTQSCRYCQSPRFTAWGSRNQMFHDSPEGMALEALMKAEQDVRDYWRRGEKAS